MPLLRHQLFHCACAQLARVSRPPRSPRRGTVFVWCVAVTQRRAAKPACLFTTALTRTARVRTSSCLRTGARVWRAPACTRWKACSSLASAAQPPRTRWTTRCSHLWRLRRGRGCTSPRASRRRRPTEGSYIPAPPRGPSAALSRLLVASAVLRRRRWPWSVVELLVTAAPALAQAPRSGCSWHRCALAHFSRHRRLERRLRR
jgi:hypothetical protein